jgi:flagellar basal-body rod protein FlgG
MRALWTAASGMEAQQFNVDVISNNLSNVNTTAYKKDRVEFKDLLYETIQRAYVLQDGGRPVNLQVGHGTTVAATLKDFEKGAPMETGGKLDFYIDGDAFFMVLGPTGEINYTRDGSFKVSLTEEGKMLSTADGYPVLDSEGEIIYLDDVNINDLVVSEYGELGYLDENGVTVLLDQTIGLVKFENRNGLESIGRNLYASNIATGDPILDEELGTRSLVIQGFLESSNVKAVEEMVKLIIAQRAYELSSKAIQSSDEMMGMANNLRR